VQEYLKGLITKGIPVASARFDKAVNNADNFPEAGFDIGSNQVSRHVDMYHTPVGLICIQKGKIFAVPWGNVIQVNFKEHNGTANKTTEGA
jgi:hypothetical protein